MKAMKNAIKNRRQSLVVRIEIEPEEIKGKGLKDPVEFAGEDKKTEFKRVIEMLRDTSALFQYYIDNVYKFE